MCYCPGSRGDFMLSLMSGSIRTVYNELYALPKDRNYIKMHSLGDVWHSDDKINTVEDLVRYRTFRIKIEDFEDAKFISYLLFYKRPFNPKLVKDNDISRFTSIPHSYIAGRLVDCLLYEKKFRPYDNLFKEVIPFKQVFNFDFLMEFCSRHSQQVWSDSDLEKIKINVTLNEQLKVQMNQLYSDKFIADVAEEYCFIRSNQEERFLEFPQTINFLSDWEFVNSK